MRPYLVAAVNPDQHLRLQVVDAVSNHAAMVQYRMLHPDDEVISTWVDRAIEYAQELHRRRYQQNRPLWPWDLTTGA